MFEAGPVSRITAAVCSRQSSRFARRQSSRRRLARHGIRVEPSSSSRATIIIHHRPVRRADGWMDGWIKKRKSRSAAAHFRVTSRRCAHHDVRDAARGERANTGEVFTQGAGGAGQHFQSGRASSASAFEAFQVFFEVPLTRVLHSWFMNRQKCIGYLVRGQGMFYKMGNALESKSPNGRMRGRRNGGLTRRRCRRR